MAGTEKGLIRSYRSYSVTGPSQANIGKLSPDNQENIGGIHQETTR